MFDLGVYLNIRFSAGLLIFPGCSRQISKTANIDGGYVVVVLCWVSGVKSGEIQAESPGLIPRQMPLKLLLIHG